jgi:hypothetical protein
MSKKQYKIIFISSFIFLVVFFIFFNVIQNPIIISGNSNIVSNSEIQTKNITATLIVGDLNLDLRFSAGMSLYEILTEMKTRGEIEFKGRNYPGLGFFVSDIGSLHSGMGKNLMYYINNQEAEVGISAYKPQAGDIISWKIK